MSLFAVPWRGIARAHHESPGIGAGLSGGGEHALHGAVRASPQRTEIRESCWLWLALCVLVASFFGIRAYREGGGPPAPLAAAVAVERAPFRPSRAIETIRVGDRVLTHNANPSAAGAPAGTAVNPATWRKLVLRARDQWPDGTLDTINVETLQPPEWITANRARGGDGRAPPPRPDRDGNVRGPPRRSWQTSHVHPLNAALERSCYNG